VTSCEWVSVSSALQWSYREDGEWSAGLREPSQSLAYFVGCYCGACQQLPSPTLGWHALCTCKTRLTSAMVPRNYDLKYWKIYFFSKKNHIITPTSQWVCPIPPLLWFHWQWHHNKGGIGHSITLVIKSAFRTVNSWKIRSWSLHLRQFGVCQVNTAQSNTLLHSCLLNKWAKFSTKIFAHVWDVVIFALGYFFIYFFGSPCTSVCRVSCAKLLKGSRCRLGWGLAVTLVPACWKGLLKVVQTLWKNRSSSPLSTDKILSMPVLPTALLKRNSHFWSFEEFLQSSGTFTPIFVFYTFFVSSQESISDRWTNRQTDGWTGKTRNAAY